MEGNAYGVTARALACASEMPWLGIHSAIITTRRVTRRGGFFLHERNFFSRCFSLDIVFLLDDNVLRESDSGLPISVAWHRRKLKSFSIFRVRIALIETRQTAKI